MFLFGTLLVQGLHRYGFFGLEGLTGIVIGLIVLIVVGLILWRIMDILLRKLVPDADWAQVIRLLVMLLLVALFLHLFGLY